MAMWNPVLETLSPDELQAVQLFKLKRIVTWAYDHAPFYREKFDRAGVKPADIQTLADLQKLPLTEKAEWLEAQGDKLSEFGTFLAMDESEIVRYHQTSGTTGSPIRLAFGHRDWNFWMECWGHGLTAAGLTNQDRIFVSFPYNLFVGWWGGQDTARLLGCRVYSGGGMTTEQRLHVIRDHEVTALMGSPSYLLRLAQMARSEMDWDTNGSSVTKLICGAEPGGSIPATRKRLEEAWGAEVFDHLGASEVGPWGYECAAHPGGVHICEGFFLMEFVNPETGEPAEPGQLVKLIITTLEKYTQPVIRFDVKDLVRVSPEPCPCGRTFRWVEGGLLGRADDMIKIRGVLFSPRVVEDVVRTFEPTAEYRVYLDRKEALDEVTLRIESGAGGETRDRLVHDLQQALKLKTNLRFVIELCEPETFPREEIKTRRVIDRRKEA